jgi:hemolysin activation/secretion protein
MSSLRFVFSAVLFFAHLPAFTAVPEAVPPIGAASESQRFPIRGFFIHGNSVIATDRILQGLTGYLGEEQTAAALLQARDAVYRLYQQAGYEMVSVELPSEIGTDGIVRLQVRETTIGRVTVTGNEHYSPEHFRAVLPSLQESRSPNLAGLARELFLANDHPGYRVALQFTPDSNGSANVEIKVKDAGPVRAALSADNTGTEATGRSRATLTASHANLWGLGHEGTAGYTTSPQSPAKVRQLVLSYLLTLPAWANRLQFGYSYSNTDAGRVADVFNVAGQGSTYSVRLQHSLRRTDTARHLIEFGIDDKRYRNTVDFFGSNLGVDVNARPVSFNYAFSGRDGATGAGAAIGYTRNLSGGARNDDATYAASRSGASSSWSVWRANAELTSAIAPEWNLRAAIDAQYTSGPLISAEQFGLGGARSVRGFQERETSGDRGWRVSSEVLSPRLAEQHRLLAFIDAGRLDRLNLLPGEAAGASLLSYGVGWRWAVGGSISTSLDWARVVRGTPTTPAGSSAVHFSASWRLS